MATIILSGAGGSTNWLPLILPIAAFLIVLLSFDFIVRQIKRWRAKKLKTTSSETES